jgi:type I restriction enzyme S subunit
MSLPRYPEYKDSGVAWLGDVPGHWSSASLRWLSTRYSGGTPDKLNLDYWTDGTIPWLNSGEVNQSFISAPSTYITEEAFRNSSAKWIPQGALVMALAGQGKTKGMVAQLGIPTTCNQSMAAIIPTQEQDARFLFWWLTSNYQNIRNMAGGDLRDGLNLELLGNIPCPLAPLTEQQTIAAFLDSETGKIDALIAEQQRLVDLLAEKRQAVISHAVTKGLNPNVQMKDSGIEWLGEVPEHWEVKRLKYIGKAFGGLIYDPSEIVEEGNGMLVLRSSNVQGGQIVFDDNVYVTTTIPEKIITQNGDILICSRNGSRALIGKNAMIDSLSSGVTFGAFMMVFRSEYSGYIFHVFNSQLFKFQSGAFLTATINQLTVGNLYSMEVPLPPVDEQHNITAYLNQENMQFNTLTAEANRAITLLQERRSALISAAVTGKIDVRESASREMI